MANSLKDLLEKMNNKEQIIVIVGLERIPWLNHIQSEQ